MNISKIPNSLLTEINSVWFGDPSVNVSIYNLNEFKLSDLYSEGSTATNGSSVTTLDSEKLSRHCYMDYSYSSELDSNIKNEFRVVFNEKKYIDSAYDKKINFSGKYISTLFFSKLSMKDINGIEDGTRVLSDSYKMYPFTGYVDLGDRISIDNIYSLIVKITINNEIELKYHYASTLDRFKDHSLNEFNKGHQDLMVGYNQTNNHLKFYKSATVKDIVIQNKSEDYKYIDSLDLKTIDNTKTNLDQVKDSGYNTDISVTTTKLNNINYITGMFSDDKSMFQTNIFVNYKLDTILSDLLTKSNLTRESSVNYFTSTYNISRYTYLGQSHPMGMFRYTFIPLRASGNKVTRFALIIIPLDLLQFRNILIYDINSNSFTLPIDTVSSGYQELFGNSLIKPIVNFYFDTVQLNFNDQSYIITPSAKSKYSYSIGSNTFNRVVFTTDTSVSGIINDNIYTIRKSPEFNDLLLYDFYNTKTLPKSLNLINDLNIYMSKDILLDSELGNKYDVADGVYSGYKTNNSFLINNISGCKIWNYICNYYSAYYKMRNIIRWLDEKNPDLSQFILFDNFMIYKNNSTSIDNYLVIPYSYKFGNLQYTIGSKYPGCNYIESYGNYIVFHKLTKTLDSHLITYLNGQTYKSVSVSGRPYVYFRGVRLSSVANNTVDSMFA